MLARTFHRVMSGDDEEWDDPEKRSRPDMLGVTLRLIVAMVALIVGLVWMVRLALDGPAVSDGLLFEVLPPLLILYLGGRYLSRQIDHYHAIREEEDDAADAAE